MLVRWAGVLFLFAMVVALVGALYLQWSVLRDVVRERDALDGVVVTLNGRLRDIEQELAQARSYKDDEALKAAESSLASAQAELAQLRAETAAAKQAQSDLREELAVERRTREAVETIMEVMASNAKNDGPSRSVEVSATPSVLVPATEAEAAAARAPAPEVAPVKAAKSKAARKKRPADPVAAFSPFSN